MGSWTIFFRLRNLNCLVAACRQVILILEQDDRTVRVSGGVKLSLKQAASGCRLLIVRSCARRNRESRQIRKEAAVTDLPLCHRATWLSAMGIPRWGKIEDRGLRMAISPSRSSIIDLRFSA